MARRPTEEREKIPEGFGEKTFVFVGADAGGPMALRKAVAVGAENQRHVRENRRLGAERAINQHLLRRVGNVIGAANDVRDAHVDVIDHDAELIGGHAVGAEQDEIFDGFVLHFVRAEDGVFEFCGAGARHFEADREGDSCGIFFGALCVGEIAARAGSSFETFYFRVRGLLCGGNVFLRFFVFGIVGRVIAAGVRGAFAVAGEAVSFGENALRGGGVHFGALRLEEGAFVPLEAEPLQEARMPSTSSGLLRSWSVSSMRRTNMPPSRLA